MAGPNSVSRPGTGEFIALAALLISLVALSIDAMLPALPAIGGELRIGSANDAQLVVSVFFIGMGLGQVVAGPLSDAVGRKPAIYGGIALFLCGCAISLFSADFETMLAGRLLQGLGASAPRVVTVAMVRDQYAGRPMARIMSFVMAVFIIVPAVAPVLGQILLLQFGWRAIFFMLVGVAILAWFWLSLRQPETHAKDRRIPFSAANLWQGARATLRHRQVRRYMIAAGLIQGVFVAYLSAAQQIFDVAYSRGDQFPLYFAILSLAIGAGSILNGRIVMRYGMARLSLLATAFLSAIGFGALLLSIASGGTPSFITFMLWGGLSFFCLGMIFGNLNALAMEPMGHIAGLAAATIGVVSTLLSVLIGITIGRMFDGTALPLIAGFAGIGLAVAVIVSITYRSALPHTQADPGQP